MNYLVVDLEGTCCNDGLIPDDERETIEIGAVLLTPDATAIADFCAFVRPVRHPELTPFCKDLTTIGQADVDRADTFRTVFPQFVAWSSGHGPSLFCSWGRYDPEQFGRDCEYQAVPYPFATHVDLAREFRRKTGRKRGHRGAMRHFGVSPEGVHHRGIADARNIAKLVPYVMCDRTVE